MRLYGVASTKSKLIGIVLLYLAIGSVVSNFLVVSASATDSEIGVVVCGASVPSTQIDITEPVSDSIVSQAVTTFRGTVANATQIEIAVDGNYSQTLAIGATDATFETSLTLTEGTHTVTMTAIGICGSQNTVDTIVLTYHQQGDPSNGDVTPTDLNTGVAVTDDPIHPDNTPQLLADVPLLAAVMGAMADFARAIGLEATMQKTNVAVGVSRIGVTVVALTSVVMASSLAPIAAQSLPGLSELFNTASHRSMLYLGWIIRGLGVFVFVLAYFL